MPSYKGISLILHKKHIPSSSPSLFTSYKSHQEYTGPYNITPRVDYVRWQEVCETSQEATELFSRFPHDIILRILRELDFTDIVSFSKVSRRCMTHTLDPYFWHSMLQRDWKGWHDYDTVLKKYNIHPVWNGNIKSTEEDTLALKRAYMTLATYKLYLAERKDESDSMKTLWEKEEFKLGHTKESNFGKVIKQKSKLFQCSVKFMYPPRGWYDVMWRIKVDKLIGEPEYAFDATVETIDINNQNPAKDQYRYTATKQDFTHVIGKGWFYFILPYAILVEPCKTIRNLKEMKLRKATKITFEFSTFNKNAQWDHASNGGFTIDYVSMRPHVPYDTPKGNRYSSGSNSSRSSSSSDFNNFKRRSITLMQKNASVILGQRLSAKLFDNNQIS